MVEARIVDDAPVDIVVELPSREIVRVPRGVHDDDTTTTKRSPSGGWETLATSGMTLPGSSVVTFDYQDASGKVNDKISRVYGVTQAVGGGGAVTLATYEYLGLGQLVGVTYPEPGTDVTYLAYDVGSPTVYGNLDRFGRRTRDLWSGGGIASGEIHDVAVAFDRNSNITSTDETLATGLAGEYPAKRDAKFTMDELNRLMRAQEGTLTSGSISTTYRDERWQDGSGNLALSQTGNWTQRRLDLSGDGDFTDTDELDDAGTFNKANEWLTRDLDNNSGTGGNNFTLTYDDAGKVGFDSMLRMAWTQRPYRWRDTYVLFGRATRSPGGEWPGPSDGWGSAPCPLSHQWLAVLGWGRLPYTLIEVGLVGWPIRFAAFGWLDYEDVDLRSMVASDECPGLPSERFLGTDDVHQELLGQQVSFRVAGVVRTDLMSANIVVHVAAWFVAITAVRWGVRGIGRWSARRGGCPQCGYPAADPAARCPECGSLRVPGAVR